MQGYARFAFGSSFSSPRPGARPLRFTGACAVAVLAVLSAAAPLCGQSMEPRSSYHGDSRGTPRLDYPDVVASKAASADQYLRTQSARYRLPADLSNLERVSVRQSLAGSHTRYRQMLNGLPVEGAEIVVSQRKADGSVYQVYNNTYPVERPVPVAQSALSPEAALQKAWDHLHVFGRLTAQPRAERLYLPEESGFRLIYKTLIVVDGPFGYWEHRVDALSGEVVSVRRHEVSKKHAADDVPDFAAYKGPTTSLQAELRRWETAAAQAAAATSASSPKGTANGTASVFDPDPRTTLANDALVNGSAAAAFSAAYVSRPLRDITLNAGVYSLQGPWVTIASIGSELPATAVSTSGTGIWTAQRGNNAFNDVMCYFHIDQNQRYLQSLGYSNAASIQATSIQVDSDGVGGDDNSHYVPSGNYLAFGHGGVDDDEDADVILHEYGHAITYDTTPTWGGGDSGAIGEGFGDYWGASYCWTCVNGSTYHPAWVFSWDGHSADTWTGRFLDMTNLTYDSTHTYPAHEPIGGIPNYSDQLWGAPLYQSFRDLLTRGRPRTEMDTVVIESYFGIGYGVTMRDMANATVAAARELQPTGPHAGVYADRFARQNILDTAYHVSAPALNAEPTETPGTSNLLTWVEGYLPGSGFGAKSAPMDNGETGVTTYVPSDTLKRRTEAERSPRRPDPAARIPTAVAAGAALPSAPAPAGSGAQTRAGWATIKSEDFEGTWPNVWTCTGNYSVPPVITWAPETFKKHAGAKGGWPHASYADPNSYYLLTANPSPAPPIRSYMAYGPFSLADATDARVTFWVYSDLGAGDKLNWMASVDGVNWYGLGITGGLYNWQQVTFDLKTVSTLGNLCGRSAVYVRFSCEADSVNTQNDGPFLDDIVIEKYVADLSQPNLVVGQVDAQAATVTEFTSTWARARIDNTGAAAAGASQAQLFLSKDGDADTSDDRFIGSVAVPGLAIGGTTWVQWDLRMPNLGAGSYPLWLVVKADSASAISESDENNTYVRPTSITVNPGTVAYYVERAANAAFTGATASGWITGTSYAFTGLQAGTTYWYRVKAGCGPAGARVESEWSNAEQSRQALPANLAPTNIVLTGTTVAENQPPATTVGTFTAQDPDAGDTFAYALTNGTGSTDNGAFAISGNALRTTATFDYEAKSSYSVRVQAADQGGLATQKVFTITVSNVNELPTNIVLSGATVAENQPSGTTVGSLGTQDTDAGDTFVYVLTNGTGGADNGSFTISGSALQTAATFNFEAKSSYSIRIRSVDQGGLSTQKVFTVTVSNVNEQPTNIVLSGATVAENLPPGTMVGAFSGRDPDAGETFAYGLTNGTGGADNGSFTISGSSLLTGAWLNYEVKSNYSIRVRSVDQGGLSTQMVFAIHVTDMDEQPVFVAQNPPSNGVMILRWSSITNHLYTIRYSTNLLNGFSVLQSNIPGTPAVNSYTDSVTTIPHKVWQITTDP